MAVKKWAFKLNSLILGCFPVASAADVPYVFENGRPALASEVNANFKAIDTTPPTLVATTTMRDDLLYIHNVTISDDTELEKFVSHYGDFVKIPGPSNTFDGSVLAAPLNGKNLEETLYRSDKNFHLGPGVKEITFDVLVIPMFNKSNWTTADGPLAYTSYFTATDTSGNTGKLMLSAPNLDGLLGNSIRPGWYELDAPITTIGPCNIEGQANYDDEPGVGTSTSYGFVKRAQDIFNIVNYSASASSDSESSDSSSNSMAELTKQAAQNALFSCPATSAFDDSDSSYSIAPRSTFSVGAIACTTKDSRCSSAIPSISYSSPYSESVFQNAFCAPAKLNQSFTNRNNQAVTNSKDGGTITSNGDGSGDI